LKFHSILPERSTNDCGNPARAEPDFPFVFAQQQQQQQQQVFLVRSLDPIWSLKRRGDFQK